jgi:hypothetical protein
VTGRSPCSSACLLRLLLHRRRPTWPDLQPAENNEAEKKAKPRTKQTQNGNKQIREPERKKTKTNCLAYFWAFTGDGDSHRRRRETEKRKRFPIHRFLPPSSAAARESTRCQWRGALGNTLPLFQWFQKAS